MESLYHEARVERIVAQGRGLLRTPLGIMFTPPGSALPGERIRFLLKPSDKVASLLQDFEILEPSPARREAACRYFAQCGACDLMQLQEAEQLQVKKGILEDCLRRIGKFPEAEVPEIGLWQGRPFGYRTRLQLRASQEGLGYLARNSHRLIPVKECLVAHANFADLFLNPPKIPANADLDRHSLCQAITDPEEGRLAAVFMNQNMPGSRRFHRLPPYEPLLKLKLHGHYREVGAEGFFQSNHEGLEELLRRLEAAMDEDLGGLGINLLELYCGSGVLGASLEGACSRILGIDLDGGASFYGERGRKIQARVGSYLAKLERVKEEDPFIPDLVLADPPRRGLDPEVFPYLARKRPGFVYLLSCDPASGARDLGRLKELGYQIKEIHILDFYPQTSHFELFTRLELDSSRRMGQT